MRVSLDIRTHSDPAALVEADVHLCSKPITTISDIEGMTTWYQAWHCQLGWH